MSSGNFNNNSTAGNMKSFVEKCGEIYYFFTKYFVKNVQKEQLVMKGK